MNKKVFIKTFGCQMNEYDSEKINDVLAKKNKLVQTTKQENNNRGFFDCINRKEHICYHQSL